MSNLLVNYKQLLGCVTLSFASTIDNAADAGRQPLYLNRIACETWPEENTALESSARGQVHAKKEICAVFPALGTGQEKGTYLHRATEASPASRRPTERRHVKKMKTADYRVSYFRIKTTSPTGLPSLSFVLKLHHLLVFRLYLSY